MCAEDIKYMPLIHIGLYHNVVSLTPYRGAASCDTGHPVPVMHAVGPRLHARALESLGQVTHLHHLKVLSKV